MVGTRDYKGVLQGSIPSFPAHQRQNPAHWIFTGSLLEDTVDTKNAA